jgi:hypothetical protein
LQKTISDKEVGIAGQQIRLAKDNVNVVRQERVMANLQLQHAGAGADFLATKFTNVDLYDFMAGVLGGVYSYFLQQASATALLAERQLAFERQDTAPHIIQADYWQAPSSTGGVVPSEVADRQGVTGSARLLEDVHRLDQHAFETRKRLLQVSQTISLAQQEPFGFELFRETGVLPFATPMELFDRGFPGHYLRLIKRVRVSIVALVPPAHGVRATLTASGISRVVIAGGIFQDSFQSIDVRRPPEQIAFTSPLNATGLLELEPEGELLLPFEGMGVDTSWELALPKPANPLDYRAISDVLLTIEFTALHHPIYREQVLQQMDPSISADRGFSFRTEFADAFYDLSNPVDEDGPLVAQFETRRSDFPPNVVDLRIQHVLLYFSVGSSNGREAPAAEPLEVPVSHLLFTERGSDTAVGGAAMSSKDGVISTRRGNGGSWNGMIGLAPAGTWELALGEEMRSRVTDGQLQDIVLVLTCAGRTPAWPV